MIDLFMFLLDFHIQIHIRKEKLSLVNMHMDYYSLTLIPKGMKKYDRFA